MAQLSNRIFGGAGKAKDLTVQESISEEDEQLNAALTIEKYQRGKTARKQAQLAKEAAQKPRSRSTVGFEEQSDAPSRTTATAAARPPRRSRNPLKRVSNYIKKAMDDVLDSVDEIV